MKHKHTIFTGYIDIINLRLFQHCRREGYKSVKFKITEVFIIRSFNSCRRIQILQCALNNQQSLLKNLESIIISWIQLPDATEDFSVFLDSQFHLRVVNIIFNEKLF